MTIIASGTATATTANGTTVTLSAGTFPTTVVGGMIFETRSGADQYRSMRVASRDSITQITLASALPTFASIDWQITNFVLDARQGTSLTQLQFVEVVDDFDVIVDAGDAQFHWLNLDYLTEPKPAPPEFSWSTTNVSVDGGVSISGTVSSGTLMAGTYTVYVGADPDISTAIKSFSGVPGQGSDIIIEKDNDPITFVVPSGIPTGYNWVIVVNEDDEVWPYYQALFGVKYQFKQSFTMKRLFSKPLNVGAVTIRGKGYPQS